MNTIIDTKYTQPTVRVHLAYDSLYNPALDLDGNTDPETCAALKREIEQIERGELTPVCVWQERHCRCCGTWSREGDVMGVIVGSIEEAWGYVKSEDLLATPQATRADALRELHEDISALRNHMETAGLDTKGQQLAARRMASLQQELNRVNRQRLLEELRTFAETIVDYGVPTVGARQIVQQRLISNTAKVLRELDQLDAEYDPSKA